MLTRDFDLGMTPNIVRNLGHFSQMVWRSSTEIGVGKAKTRCGKIFVVANYKPAGNVIGEFQNNVYPPEKSSQQSDELEGMLI